jgi:hypothetical protein
MQNMIVQSMSDRLQKNPPPNGQLSRLYHNITSRKNKGTFMKIVMNYFGKQVQITHTSS